MSGAHGRRGGDHVIALPPPELWTGVECTVNRVGERWFDQLVRNGHHVRAEADIDRLASLGVRALRVPVLWERVVRSADADAARVGDWRWSDRVLGRMRALGLRPIVTLLHHGSGPAGTSLLDPALPARLGAFARTVAERYPWVEDWTPVNEPLTTARFAALYGVWYPHARDEQSFARALLTQVHGVRHAMAAVRAVTPSARLVQTEDLGKTYATPALAYQAEFENDRRWASFDALAGRLSPEAPFGHFLRWCGGIGPSEFAELADAPCPADVIGVNHYLTSERFLDRRLAIYPAHTHGGNGRDRYADVEAVRVLAEGPDGPEHLLEEAWGRYARPIAVTEVHLGCTREQQIRWLAQVWTAACRLRARGVDVCAVTPWAALGSYDWNSLLTTDAGYYEPGLFDVRGPEPRETALATVVRDLATRGRSAHPALVGPGWWEMPSRLLYTAVPKRGTPPRSAARPRAASRLGASGTLDRRAASSAAGQHGADHSTTALTFGFGSHMIGMAPPETPRPVLVTGARGTLARALVRACAERGLACVALERAELDAADAGSVERAMRAYQPWAVVNAAGYVRVDDAEREREACWRENVVAPETLARACAAHGARLATYSTDLVFDGALERERRAYVEHDVPAPLNVYGASKAEAEARVQALLPEALVLRTSAFFGPWDEWNFLTLALRELSAGRPFTALSDVTVSPTYVPDLAHATLDLVIDGAAGVWHLASAGALTWYDFARLGAERAGVDTGGLVAQPLAEARLAAARPRWAVLGSARGQLLGSVENAICHYVGARAALSSVSGTGRESGVAAGESAENVAGRARRGMRPSRSNPAPAA